MVTQDRELNNSGHCKVVSPSPLSQSGRGSKSPVPLLPNWEKGLGEGFAPLREEGEDPGINKSMILRGKLD